MTTNTNTAISGKALVGIRDLFIETLIAEDLQVNQFAYVGRGVDGLIFADEDGTTVVAKIIVKKEIGIFDELIGEYNDREDARIAREKALAEKKELALAKKQADQAKKGKFEGNPV